MTKFIWLVLKHLKNALIAHRLVFRHTTVSFSLWRRWTMSCYSNVVNQENKWYKCCISGRWLLLSVGVLIFRKKYWHRMVVHLYCCHNPVQLTNSLFPATMSFFLSKRYVRKMYSCLLILRLSTGRNSILKQRSSVIKHSRMWLQPCAAGHSCVMKEPAGCPSPFCRKVPQCRGKQRLYLKLTLNKQTDKQTDWQV